MDKRKSIVFFLSGLICSVILIGCTQKDDNSEAARAQVLLPKVQKDLDRVKRNNDSLIDRLRAVELERNMLSQQVNQLTTAGQNVSEMTAKINEQGERITYLETQIDELNAVIESQRNTISEQQSTIAELVSFFERPDSETQEVVMDQNNSFQ
ncbi:MAG: hypothetical protein JW715_09660 [Sedimentisphaerales bacterium]|nr:hypothetical protein [Sedimentisphaerales bacterium]